MYFHTYNIYGTLLGMCQALSRRQKQFIAHLRRNCVIENVEMPASMLMRLTKTEYFHDFERDLQLILLMANRNETLIILDGVIQSM